MKCCVLFCVLISVVYSLPADIHRTEWEKFKQTYEKTYLTEEEESQRYQIFSENLDNINEHNKLYEQGLTSYKMGINEFTDFTKEEYQKMMGLLHDVDSSQKVLLDQITDDVFQKEWVKFKESFGRLYSSSEEEQFRYKIFCSNLKAILQHNEDYKKGLTTFEMGVNNFSDMTPDEMKVYMGVRRRDNSATLDSHCETQWPIFKNKFAKTYSTSEEEMRLSIFCNNLNVIEKHNEDYKNGLTTFKMGTNQFSDMTSEEMKKYMGIRRSTRSVGDSCKNEYEQFKKSFNKVYETEEEEMNHLTIFCQNLDVITEHNEQFEKGLTTFKMGINRFTDMTAEEMQKYLGFLGRRTHSSYRTVTQLPEDVYETEWRKFKETYRKSYLSEEEENHRYSIFRKNLDTITQQNELFEKGLATSTMGVNQFTDLTQEEFQEMLKHGL